jgi:hypothetical protein
MVLRQATQARNKAKVVSVEQGENEWLLLPIASVPLPLSPYRLSWPWTPPSQASLRLPDRCSLPAPPRSPFLQADII